MLRASLAPEPLSAFLAILQSIFKLFVLIVAVMIDDGCFGDGGAPRPRHPVVAVSNWIVPRPYMYVLRFLIYLWFLSFNIPLCASDLG